MLITLLAGDLLLACWVSLKGRGSCIIQRGKNPALPHGASSKEKAILTWAAVWRTNDVRWRTNDVRWRTNDVRWRTNGVRWRTNDVRWLQALMAIHPSSL